MTSQPCFNWRLECVNISDYDYAHIFIVLLLYSAYGGKGSIYCTKGSSEMPPDLVTWDYLFVLGLFRLRQYTYSTSLEYS